MANERIIKVTGKGNLKVRPDVTRITITLDGQNKEYGKILEQSSKDTEELKDILEKQGFERSDVKTLLFNVDTRYESYQTKDRSWKERFVGFEYTHKVKIEFDSDNTRLGRILYALATAKEIHPDFRLSYTVKDKEGAKNELLGKA
ncbi:MAG: SIMPL domain-containing protein, partial [Butyrivibrio sp.]|nr:SIMPL domain-containing protein [Butyrivibrio sp.]